MERGTVLPAQMAPTLQDKVAALHQSSAFPDVSLDVEARETRMSWVFLTDHFAYKLKKPVTTSHVDFSTPCLRHACCAEEVRLNARLAPGIYLGVVPLTLEPNGTLRMEGTGEPVDWLVKMRRLPTARMLDMTICHGIVWRAEIEAVADRLAEFYAAAVPVKLSKPEYMARFSQEQEASRAILHDSRFGLSEAAVEAVLTPVDAMLRAAPDMLTDRIDGAGRIVEGHGDLRPEHICLGPPMVVIDCLDFSRRLRLLDPFEELAFLGMECTALGAGWIGQLMVTRVAARLRDPIPQELIAFYTAFRAGLRARQAVAHLLDPAPRDPAKWLPQARRYLDVGAEAALNIPAPAIR